MGVIPTPTNFKTLTFDGENSRSYGVYITGEGVFNAPERNVEMVEIPGRNGSFALDKGNFNNIEVTYPAGIYAATEEDFAQAVSDFRNFLCSKVGYVRLEDDYNPNEYRLAIYKSGLDVDHDFLIAGEFDLTFECKPQRYLKSGETPITIGEWGDTETYEGAIAEFDNPNGYLAVKSLTADITPLQDLHGYDKPWVGGSHYNQWDEDWELGGINETTGQKTVATDTIRSKNYIPIIPDTNYYVKTGGTTYVNNIVPHFYDSDYNYISYINGIRNAVITTPPNAMYMLFRTISAYGTTYNHDIAINYPSSVTTYSPWENLCPITGWTGCEVSQAGVNLFDGTLLNGYYDADNNGVFVASGSWRATEKIRCKPSTTYVMSGSSYSSGSYNGRSLFWDINGNYLGHRGTGANFTSYPNSAYMALYFGSSYVTDVIQIEEGSTATDYTPYNGTTKTITFEDEQGNQLTVYGGKDEIIGGVLTVTHGIADMGTLPWSKATTSGANWRFSADLSGAKIMPSASTMPNMACGGYKVVTPEATWVGTQGVSANTNTAKALVCDMSFSDAASFKTAMNGVQLVYELATPITYQLDPVQVACLLGQNNAWNNVGDTSIEVGNDPKYVINPTRFDAQPKLEVEGYGNIAFNGFNIELFDDLVGTVYAEQNAIHYLPYSNYIGDIYVNANDGISLHSVYIGFSITRGSSDFTIDTCTDSDLQYGGLPDTPLISIVNNGETLNFGIAFDDVNFSALTAGDGWASVTLTVTDSNGVSFSNNYRVSVKYDGVGAIEYSITGINIPNQYYISTQPIVSYSFLKIDSTATTYGHPTLVDCETGEVYTIKNDIAMSLGRYVALGSELPTLASGANAVTYDNTITSLKVTPKWWQV